MATKFTLATKPYVDTYQDTVSVGDAVSYEFDCTPWQEDNDTITSATWVVESGQASITGSAIVSGVVSSLVSFAQSGKVLISILLGTAAGYSKKIWLEVRVKDQTYTDDYGMGE